MHDNTIWWLASLSVAQFKKFRRGYMLLVNTYGLAPEIAVNLLYEAHHRAFPLEVDARNARRTRAS